MVVKRRATSLLRSQFAIDLAEPNVLVERLVRQGADDLGRFRRHI
jgi:hypothetical protein